MDTALVTGADHGIGLQIARQLVELGYRVYGLAADFSTCNWQHHDFLQIRCDLSRLEHLRQAWEHIAEHNPQVGVVVHAQRSPVFAGGFESAAAEDIAHCVQGCLLAPLLLTRWALPSLVRFRGHVISVGWNAQGSCPRGATAAAIEGGLYHWAQGLFDELRDTGVKVCTVYPWRNPGVADPKARLKLEPQSEVDAKFVAQAVAQILQARENNLLAQVVVRPQGTREEPRIAPSGETLLAGPRDIVLPDPDKRPPPVQPIPTPEPRRPDDAWEFDDEEDDDWEEDDELDALLESSRRMLREQNESARRQLQRTREKAERRPERSSPDKGKSRKQAEGNRSRQGGQEGGTKEKFSPTGNGGASVREDPQVANAAPRRAAYDETLAQSPADRAEPPAARAGDTQPQETADESKRRRRRRRGGRGRNRKQGGEGAGEANGMAAPSATPGREATSQESARERITTPKATEARERTATETQERTAGSQPAGSAEQRAHPQVTHSRIGGSQPMSSAGQRAAAKSAEASAGAGSRKPADAAKPSGVSKPVDSQKLKPAARAEERSSAATAAGAVKTTAESKSAGIKPAAKSAPEPAVQPATGSTAKPATKPATKPGAEQGGTQPAKKKVATKKAATKKTATKKTAATKAAVKKVATRKTAAKKATAKSTVAKQAASAEA